MPRRIERTLSQELEDAKFRAAYEAQGDRMSLMRDLVKARRDAHITQEFVAERLGLSQSTVAEFERSSDPHVSTLQRYAAAIGCRVDFILVPAVGAAGGESSSGSEPRATAVPA